MIDEPFAVKEYTIAIHRAKPRSHHRTDSGLCIHSVLSPRGFPTVVGLVLWAELVQLVLGA